MPEIGGEIGAERNLGLLLKTGQKTQYGGYADDGYYEKGLSKLYTVLTTGQYAGTTSITLSDKTDLLSNNCVYDRRTKLVWLRYPSDGLGHGGDGKLPWTTNSDGEGIYALAATANAAKLALYTDWRVASDIELINLRDMEQPTAAPNAIAFPGWPTSDYLWASTTQPSYDVYAMIVYFTNGYVRHDDKNTSYFVALVRGG